LRAPQRGQGTEKSSGSLEMSVLIGISFWQFLQVTAFTNAALGEVSILRLNMYLCDVVEAAGRPALPSKKKPRPAAVVGLPVGAKSEVQRIL